MSRVLAVIAACLLFASMAHADTVDANVRQLANATAYKVRLASALALAKSRDPRAVIGLAAALADDSDPTVRRVAALALEKNVDARTPEDARTLALDALAKAEQSDPDAKVRGTAASALRSLAGLRKQNKSSATHTPTQKPQSVFVNIDSTIDQSKKLPNGAGDRISKIVKAAVDTTGYATSWPGGLPTQKELAKGNAQGYIVASTVKKIDITKSGPQTQIACTLAIRVSPWDGTDGGEKWEANRAASASGSAKATTGNDSRSIQGGVRDCLEAVTENVTTRQVVPFLKRLSGS